MLTVIKSIAVATALLLFSYSLQAQKNIYLLGGFQFSELNYNYRFQQQGKILQRGFKLDDGSNPTGGTGFAFNVALHYRLSRYVGLEAGSQATEMDLLVRDADFQNRNNTSTSASQDGILNGVIADHGNYDFARWYSSNYLAGYLFLPNSSGIHPYLAGGVAFNTFLPRQRSYPASYFYQDTGETLQLTAHYSKNYMHTFLESGVFIHRGDFNQKGNGGACVFIGFKYYLAGNMLSGDYQNIQNGAVKYSDHVVASGSYVALSIRVGGTIFKDKDWSNQIEKHVHAHSAHRYSTRVKHVKRMSSRSKKSGRNNKKEKITPIKTPPNAKGW